MAKQLAPLPKFRWFDTDGTPLASGKVYTYQEGTTTNKATYTDEAGGTTNANPVILDSNGEADIWLDNDVPYKFVIKDSADTTLATIDNIHSIFDPFDGAYTTSSLQFADNTGLLDDSGNEQLILQKTTNAVNHFEITNAATGNNPTIAPAGDDNDIDFVIKAKGSGSIQLLDTNSNEIVGFGSPASGAVNYVEFTNAATTNAPVISVAGDDNNIDVVLTGKGTGKTIIRDSVEIQDASSNELLVFSETSSAVNHLQITNQATGSNPVLSAVGSDTDVSLNFAVQAAGVYNFTATSSGSAEIRCFEDSDNGSNYLGFKPPAAVTTSTTFTLPDGDGSAEQVLETNGSGTLSWVNLPSSISQAVKADIEGETNQDTYIPPDLLKHHPGIAKAWVTFDGTGTPAIDEDYNVDSIGDNGTGDYTINFTTNFSNTTYAFAGGAEDTNATGDAFLGRPNAGTKSAAAMQIAVLAADATAFDSPEISVVFFGDQ